MADEIRKGQAATQDQDKDIPTTGPDIKATPEQIKQTEEITEKFKREIAGLNRKISDFEKQLQAKELETLSEKERALKEIELAKVEKDKLLKETEEIKKDRIKDRELHSAGIPVEFAKRIMGNNEDEIVSDVKAFKFFIDDLVKKGVESEINKKLGGRAPEGNTGLGEKVVTRENFYKLNPMKQTEFIKGGGKITD